MKLEEKLIEIKACEDALEWAKGKTFAEAWATCHRGDWMLCFASQANLCDLRTLTLMKGECAALAKEWMLSPDSIAAVDAAIAFGRGLITREQLDAAAARAAAAAYDAARATRALADALAAARAVAHAADAARAAAADRDDAAAADLAAAAADRAALAADAADRDADAADVAFADGDAENDVLRQCAEICRRVLPNPKFAAPRSLLVAD